MTRSPHPETLDAPTASATTDSGLASNGTFGPTQGAADAVMRASRRCLPHLAGFSLAINILALALPLFVLQVFDRVLTSHSMATLWALAAGCVGALAVMAALDLVRSRILTRAGQGLERDLAPGIVTLGRTDGLADLARLRAFIAGPAMAALMDLPWTPLFIAVAFVVHPAVGWIALGGALTLLALAWVAEVHGRGYEIAAGPAEAEARHLAEAAAACRRAGALRPAAGLAGKWGQVQDRAWRARLDGADRGGAYAVFAKFTRLGLQVLVISVAAVLAVGGEITAGGMIAALVLLGRALAPYERAQDLWRGIIAARVALARLVKLPLVAAPERTLVLAPEEEVVLDVRNLVCMPDGAVEPLFAGVRFKARGGDMIGVTGPSGAGKSVLLGLLAGRSMPDRGRVMIAGQDALTGDGRRLDMEMGYLAQSPVLLPGTVMENITGFAADGKYDLSQVAEAARLAGADRDIRGLVHGYDTRIGPGGLDVPAGLAQRIAIARALIGRPRLILLDEPYTHLDNAGVEALIAALDDLRRDGAVVVIVAQRPSVLVHCTRVLVVDGGRARIIDRRRKADLRVLSNPPAEAASAEVAEFKAAPAKPRKKSGVRK